jgi:hypothetical protein
LHQKIQKQFSRYWNLPLQRGYVSNVRMYGSCGCRQSCISYGGSSFQWQQYTYCHFDDSQEWSPSTSKVETHPAYSKELGNVNKLYEKGVR